MGRAACWNQGWIPRASLAVTLLAVGGCVATDPDQMQQVYVSPDDYRDLDCTALAREMQFAGARTLELYDELEKRRRADLWQAGAFWPTFGLSALYLDGDGPEADEYRRIKGQFEALRMAGYRKDCGLEGPSPEEIVRRAQARSVTGARADGRESTAAPTGEVRPRPAPSGDQVPAP